jgi:amino acid adenylation domain-containing protein
MSTRIKEMFPLSPQQRRLWRLQRACGASPFRAHCALLFEGPFDPETFKAALLSVVHRHEILRTSFQESNGSGVPAQAVTDCGVHWDEFRDISSLEDGLQQTGLSELIRGAEGLALHTEGGPPVRASVVKLSDSRHILLLTMPALCADAPTLGKLTREIGRAYAAHARGQQLDAQAEPLQYADVSQWLNELLESDLMRAGREHWLRQSAGGTGDFRLAFERRASSPAGFEPRRAQLGIEPELWSKITDASGLLGTRPELFLHAAWQVLLWNHGQHPQQVVVGTAHDGLNFEELADTLGPLTKYLPIRCGLDADQTFQQLVAQTAELSRQAHDYQQFYCAEESVRDDEQPAPDIESVGEPEFFPFSFDFQYEDEPFEANGLTVSVLSNYVCSDRFKLKLGCGQQRRGLSVELHYDAGLFSEDDARTLLSQFRTLLASAAECVEAPLSLLSLIEPLEQRRLAESFGGAAKFERGRCLHQLFEEQVERVPERVAVVCGESALSYRELNERANRLAHWLRDRGRGPERMVALCMERTENLAVAVLGILKSGAAYLPLDPQYPAGRLRYIVEESGVGVVLTEGPLAELFGETKAEVVRLEAEWPDINRRDGRNPANLTEPDSTAYVIYTSGSTGRPKGVMVTHANVTSLFDATRTAFRITEDDTWTLFHSIAFDFSVWELWGALLYGGRVVVVPYLLSRTPSAFLELLGRERVTVLNQTPSAFRQLMEAERQAGAGASSLRLVIFGGEALEVPTLRPWVESHGDERPRLVNMYGITETTVHVTRRDLSRRDVEQGGSPIGAPIESLQLYVLDRHGRPAAVGVAGELYVGGCGVARGYLNRAGLTAERFVPNPFGPEAGSRLYKTGDVGRRLGDGEIEYLGRADQQVKIRGFRIELGEIESVLAEHADISEAVAAVHQDVRGEKHLVAYYVARRELGNVELREHLRAKLPEYMTPSVFMRLEALPLTTNGKLDRKALPAVGAGRRAPGEQHAEARTPVEEMVCAIWSETLGVAGVGLDENFFELGGHSLLATQLISRVREAFGIELPLPSLFEHQTPGAFAGHVEQEMAKSLGLLRPPIERVPREGLLPVSYVVEGRLLNAAHRREHNLPPEPVNINLGYHWRGPLDAAALSKSLGEVMRRHEALRTGFEEADGVYVQRISPSVDVPLQFEDVRSLPPAQRWWRRALATLRERFEDVRSLPPAQRRAAAQRILNSQGARPFDLSEPPLLRAALVQLADDEFAMMFTVDHSVFDGWSAGIFLHEIMTLYRAFASGEESPLGELPVQYADFSAWQRGWLRGEVLERLVAYWRQHLDGHEIFPRFELPGGRPREEVKSFLGDARSITLTEELSRSLRAASRANGVTAFMLLLAGLKAVLHRRTGMQSIGLMIPTANRATVETEKVIGWFAHRLVLRTDLSGDPTFTELLGRAREVTLGALAHQDLPFSLLRRELGDTDPTARTPHIYFNLTGAAERAGFGPAEESRLPGVSITPVGFGSGAAEPGLNIEVSEATDNFVVTITYEAECYGAEVIAQLLEHYESLLESVVENPAQRLSEIPLLTRSERKGEPAPVEAKDPDRR